MPSTNKLFIVAAEYDGPSDALPITLGDSMSDSVLDSTDGVQAILSTRDDVYSIRIHDNTYHLYEPFPDAAIKGARLDYLQVQISNVVKSWASHMRLWFLTAQNRIYHSVLGSTDSAEAQPISLGFEDEHRILELAPAFNQDHFIAFVEGLGMVFCEPDLPTGSESPFSDSWTFRTMKIYENIVELQLTDDFFVYSTDDTVRLRYLDRDCTIDPYFEKLVNSKLPKRGPKKIRVSASNDIAIITEDGDCICFYKWTRGRVAEPITMPSALAVDNVLFAYECLVILTKTKQVFYRNYEAVTWTPLEISGAYANVTIHAIAPIYGTRRACAIGTMPNENINGHQAL